MFCCLLVPLPNEASGLMDDTNRSMGPRVWGSLSPPNSSYASSSPVVSTTFTYDLNNNSSFFLPLFLPLVSITAFLHLAYASGVAFGQAATFPDIWPMCSFIL
ncbi:hypothetical protein ACOSP7_021935 [Xanthoceras sorbifolium]